MTCNNINRALTASSSALMLGCCLERMSEIPDNSVDMIFTDLPYGTTACKWDNIIAFEPLWAHYKRVAKRDAAIVLTSAQPFTSKLVMSNIKAFKYSLVWDKVKITGFLNAKKMPLRRHEDILVFCYGCTPYKPTMEVRGEVRNKGGGTSKPGGVYREINKTKLRNNVYYPTSIIVKSNSTSRSHPTEKAVGLMEYLIQLYSDRDQIVLDSTMGSGSTGVACVTTGRRFIGIERDPSYFEIARRRIGQAMAQQVASADDL